MSKVKLATRWFDGCSGCHMSLLDIDERLIDLAPLVELVHSPLVDAKEIPEGIDAAFVEGAISSDEDERIIRRIRERSRLLVAFGDCAVTGNVPAMRNRFKVEDCLRRAYVENAAPGGVVPSEDIPSLRSVVRPVHSIVSVDVFLPGRPPPAESIFFLVGELLQGRIPDLTGKSRFGA
jgi:NAD-reducing hydrogenase small subunit